MADGYHRVAVLSELAQDSGHCVLVGGRQVALFRRGSEVFALANLCPHQGGPLAEGWLEGDRVICPIHGWEFDLRSGVTANGSMPVATYAVRLQDDEVLISMDESRSNA